MGAPVAALLLFCLLSLLAASTGSSGGGVPAPRPQPFGDGVGGVREAFPAGFVFGTATSAYQVEGMADKDGRGPSIWDVFIKTPGIEPDNASGEVAVDQYHRYKEDVDIMANLNFDAHRFSISWSRIFPNGTGEVNWKGVAYYHRLIDYMVAKGITPYANLNHYDIPQALEDRYLGWLSKDVVKDYADFAEFCFKMFGDRVKNWMTFNEPRVAAALGYDNGFFAPGRCSKGFGNCTLGNSGTEPYIVAHNLILSHAAAVQRYREKDHKKEGLEFSWILFGMNHSQDQRRITMLHREPETSILDVYGEYPRTMQEIVGKRLPEFTKDEVTMVKGSIDIVGINQYTTYYMYNPHRPSSTNFSYQQDWNVGFAYDRKGVPIGKAAHSSWLYEVPWGLYKAINYIKEHYGNPTMILAENGMDDPGNVTLQSGLHDIRRIQYFRSYLDQLKKVIDDGANVIGYFAWSLLDNFEWRLGYTSRFGIVYVDYRTLRRYPKMSGLWFKRMLARKRH